MFWVRVKRRPLLSKISTCQGFLTSRTRPYALVYVTASAVCSTLHVVSVFGVPSSIIEGSSVIGAERVFSLIRIARGLTKLIENGRPGFSSYSVAGNSVDRLFTSTLSTLLKDKVVLRIYLAHSSVPCPVEGSNFVT